MCDENFFEKNHKIHFVHVSETVLYVRRILRSPTFGISNSIFRVRESYCLWWWYTGVGVRSNTFFEDSRPNLFPLNVLSNQKDATPYKRKHSTHFEGFVSTTAQTYKNPCVGRSEVGLKKEHRTPNRLKLKKSTNSLEATITRPSSKNNG